MAKRRQTRTRIRKNRTGMFMITVVVLILCAIVMFNGIQLKSKISDNQAVQAELQAQIEEQEELKQALEEKSVYVQSKEYIEELAREKLGLVKENEIIFKKQEN